MGQQQLLLIVLGVIIVGIAVVVGINVFTASSFQANQDAVVADLTNIAAMAQQHYRKPLALGGGGNSFDNWEPPAQLNPTLNMNAAMTVTGNAGQGPVVLTATGTEVDSDGNRVTVIMTVGPDRIISTTFGAAEE